MKLDNLAVLLFLNGPKLRRISEFEEPVLLDFDEEAKKGEPSGEGLYDKLLLDVKKEKWGNWRRPRTKGGVLLSGAYLTIHRINEVNYPSETDQVLGVYDLQDLRALENMMVTSIYANQVRHWR